MVTKHVQNLEQRIGSRLLNRTPRNVSLTEVGATYYERCVALLADLEEAESLCDEIAVIRAGRIIDRGSAASLRDRYEARDISEVYARVIAAEVTP